MKWIINFIKDMFDNYLIRKTYKAEMKNLGKANEAQIEMLFANDGIELH